MTKQRIYKVLENAVQVYKNRHTKIPTSKLNEVLLSAIENYPPPAHKGKYVKIKYVTMLRETYVPTFVFFCNLPQWVKDPYKRYLENKIRENWNFSGTPINIFMREKNKTVYSFCRLSRSLTDFGTDISNTIERLLFL